MKSSTRRTIALLLVTCVISASACTTGPTGTAHLTPAPLSGEMALPPPSLVGEKSLEEVIASRRSMREFADQALSWSDISQLLWSAQGITDPGGLRTAPSAGALYPLEIYVALPDGAYHYLPCGHAVESVSAGDLREDLWQAGLRQDALRQAPAIFVIAAVYERTEAKYGERAERYVHLEAGHAAQNMLLQAVALELGAVPIGAFSDDLAQAALGLPADHRPLYLIPVGHPLE
ncbi:MAG: SagB/ThcOx family dehydrogenase [Anaerolineae bacterium]|nr:SagB/ThcOx family dehydrogenase [Anaerolineae bacterium]